MELARTHYVSITSDSARWEGFDFRDGDIIISTPPKCGTTWMQTICALLIFQTTEFPKALDVISPWLEQTIRTRESVVADLEAQEHRRFIKSHTPLDGIPLDERVTYICVGRDPRDVALSWDNHMDNIDLEAFLALREKAVGLEDVGEFLAYLPPPMESAIERLWQWVDDPAPVTKTLAGLAFTLTHLTTFFEARPRANVLLAHYGELQADLSGEMRRLAEQLGIDVPEGRWGELVNAATFTEMKRRAKDVGPNTTEPIWKDTDRFFHRGTSGQWRELLDEEDLRRYSARVAELADKELSNWVHQGPIIP